MWLKVRNSCHENIACIKDSYLQRNAELSSIVAFETISSVFSSNLIDTLFGREMTNDSGFIIKDNPWQIKKLFSEHQKEESLNSAPAGWDLLSHVSINNDLMFIFKARTKDSISLVAISDVNSRSYVITSYKIDSDNDPYIELIKRDDGGFSYVVRGMYNSVKNKQLSNYYRIDIVDGTLSEPQTISQPTEDLEKEDWIGYCGEKSCESVLTSPDGKWRLASGDDKIKYLYEGVFYFPHDRPDLGVNVFISGVEKQKDDGWSYSRNYSWGLGDSFFFDNDGAMACIWKIDISKKTTERILPIEGLRQPYYIDYDDEEYVVSRYVSETDDDKVMAGFYISKK